MSATRKALDLWPSQELMAIFDRKYRRSAVLGRGPQTRLEFGYFSPDDHYETIVARLLQPGAWWADIVFFAHLDDCLTFDKYRWLNQVQRFLRSLDIRYPENCLLGVYRKDL